MNIPRNTSVNNLSYINETSVTESNIRRSENSFLHHQASPVSAANSSMIMNGSTKRGLPPIGPGGSFKQARSSNIARVSKIKSNKP